MLEYPCLGLDTGDQAKLAFCVLLVTVTLLLENIWARSMVPRATESAASPIPVLVVCHHSYVYGSFYLSCRLQVVLFVWAHRLPLGFDQVLSFSLQETIWNSYSVSCLEELDLEIKHQVLQDIQWKPQSLQWQVSSFCMSFRIYISFMLTVTICLPESLIYITMFFPPSLLTQVHTVLKIIFSFQVF